jgi:nucleotide sugar dehydrogenase
MPVLKTSGADFDLAFCPERTIEGKALSELRGLPQIVGGLSQYAAVRASQLFHFITPTVVRVSDVETAELIKMIDNSYRDIIFAHANEVARISDAVGVSAAEAIQAGTLGYPRVTIPMPGPVGGPCLAKDPYILDEGLQAYGIRPEIAMTARRINERQPEEIIGYLSKITGAFKDWPEKPVICLMGIAFKGRPATDDLRGTMARPIFQRLKKHFPQAEYRGFDPMVTADNIRTFGLKPFESIQEAMKDAHLVLILNNHPIFGQIPIENLAQTLARPGLIYDFWNNFTASDLHLPKDTGYMALGSHGKAVLPDRVEL